MDSAPPDKPVDAPLPLNMLNIALQVLQKVGNGSDKLSEAFAGMTPEELDKALRGELVKLGLPDKEIQKVFDNSYAKSLEEGAGEQGKAYRQTMALPFDANALRAAAE